jgi:hypothetical protein
MLIVEERLFPRLLIAPVVEEPALRRLGQTVPRKIGSYLEQSQGGESIGCVLFTPEHRQVHFGYMYVPHFVEQQNQRISHHEFHPVYSLLLREVLETGIVLERWCSRFDPGLKGR